ncbi:hypothetical protein BDR07DRAFT_1483700 [Suillus spraguei]|nr:hypothetical protein BDR07DRAFT_1483700 [Suillus spraguei]
MVGPTDGFSDADHYGSSSHSHKAVILPTTRPPFRFGDSWDQRSLQFDKDAGIPEQRIPPDWTESSGRRFIFAAPDTALTISLPAPSTQTKYAMLFA